MSFSSSTVVTTYYKTYTGSGLIRLMGYDSYYVKNCGYVITVDGKKINTGYAESAGVTEYYIPFASSLKIFCWYNSDTSADSKSSITAHVVLF